MMKKKKEACKLLQVGNTSHFLKMHMKPGKNTQESQDHMTNSCRIVEKRCESKH